MKGMKKIGKQLIVYLLAFLMLFTIAPMSALAEDEVQLLDTEQVLTIGEEVSVAGGEGEVAWLSFTPQESGDYKIWSYDKNEGDPKVYLYDESKTECLGEDDDSGEDNNFTLIYSLEGGTTYYYEAKTYNDGAFEYKVQIKKIEYVNVTFHAGNTEWGACFDNDDTLLDKAMEVEAGIDLCS